MFANRYSLYFNGQLTADNGQFSDAGRALPIDKD